MAKGKQGLWLEAWKFGVYLAIPIAASYYYSDAARQKKSADYWQYVKYPANPNVHLKEQIEELSRQKEQRQAYKEQLQQLNDAARRTRNGEDKATASPGWWRRWLSSGEKQPGSTESA